MRALRLLLAAAAAMSIAVVPGAPAGARGTFEHITAFDVLLRIEDDGSLLVRETIDYDFGTLFRHGIFRDVPVRSDYPDKAHHDRVHPLEVVSVRAGEGTPDEYALETVDGSRRIKIGDPDRTITGEHRYEITYRVEGALDGFRDHDELEWDAIGADWQVTIERATVTVEAPATITRVTCFSGPAGSSLPCESATSAGAAATFAQPELLPFDALTVVVGIPKGAVPRPRPILEERWWLGRGFEASAANVGGAGGLLAVVLAGVGLLAYRRGRDRRFAGSPVDAAFGSGGAPEEPVPLLEQTETPVEFTPPDGVRPGQVGTLVDFTANPLDVTATIVDLAVRGYLVIEEIPGTSRRPDWKLTKKREPEDLKAYERRLMEGLFRGEDDEVVLSELRYKFAKRMHAVQRELVDDAMDQGWFSRRPGSVRTAFALLGVLALVLGVVLLVVAIAFTRLALVPIPIVLGGILLVVAAYWMPARTAKGYSVLRRVDGFRRFIDESEAERARFAERKHLFSEYLPYAVVFGATEKWAKAFAGLDDELPDTSAWYVGAHAFTVAGVSDAIGGFTVSSAGTLASTPPSTSSSSGSGFGGGGFSGGGGGGGGGGSW